MNKSDFVRIYNDYVSDWNYHEIHRDIPLTTPWGVSSFLFKPMFLFFCKEEKRYIQIRHKKSFSRWCDDSFKKNYIDEMHIIRVEELPVVKKVTRFQRVWGGVFFLERVKLFNNKFMILDDFCEN